MGEVRIKTASQIAHQHYESKCREVRKERNRLLAESDCTQLPDSPFDATAWQTYRQALRDLTEQSGFPDNIEWPEAP